MTEFLGDIAGMLEIFAIAGGLVLLHHASKDSPAKLLKAAAWLLVAAGVGFGACTMYYWARYWNQGAFASSGCQMGGARMMGGGNMTGAGPMGGPMMGGGHMTGAGPMMGGGHMMQHGAMQGPMMGGQPAPAPSE